MSEKINYDSSSLPGDGECPADSRVITLINQLRANSELPFAQAMVLSVAAVSSKDAQAKELSSKNGS